MLRGTQKIDVTEIEEKEVIEISMLKRDLLKLLNDYKSSRIGLITFLFRDQQLTKKKLVLVDETITLIKNFEGTKEDLITQLKMKRIENADISRQHEKYHYNLLEKREVRYRDSYGDIHVKHAVKKGESSNKSGFANLLHDAIQIVQNSKISPNIRNTIKNK